MRKLKSSRTGDLLQNSFLPVLMRPHFFFWLQEKFGQCSEAQAVTLRVSCAGLRVGLMVFVGPFRLGIFWDSVENYTVAKALF